MATDMERFQIDQLSRIAASIGWNVIATDTAGNSLRVTLEKPKEQTKKE